MSSIGRTAGALLVTRAVCGCGGGDDVGAPTARTVVHDPSDGRPGCAAWAAHPPTAEERAEGCVGANADMDLDAAAAVPPCDECLRRTVMQRDVGRGCRAGPVGLAVTADEDCTAIGEPRRSCSLGSKSPNRSVKTENALPIGALVDVQLVRRL